MSERVPDKLDIAIAEFEDENSDIPFEQRLSNLRTALMWNAFEAIKRVKRYGTKSPLSEEEEYKQVECMKQFKMMEAMYNSELRMAKSTGKRSEDIDRDYLKKIHSMKDTIAPIVRNMNEKTGTNG